MCYIGWVTLFFRTVWAYKLTKDFSSTTPVAQFLQGASYSLLYAEPCIRLLAMVGLSVCPSLCPSVRHTLALIQNYAS